MNADERNDEEGYPVIHDRRVTRFVEWMAGIGASILIAALVWIGATLMDVQQKLAVLQVQTAPASNRMDRIEAKIESMRDQSARIELRLTSMEACQVRQVGQ